METQKKLLETIDRIKHEPRLFFKPTSQNHSFKNEPIPDSKEENQKSNIKPKTDTIHDVIPTYKKCEFLNMPLNEEIHKLSGKKLADIVAKVVAIEGPVHFQEVVIRIRSLWGLKRAGNRIYTAIERGTMVAKKQGQINRKGNFLWPVSLNIAPVRRRCEDIPTKIELICDEEIAEAIKVVLLHQHATPLEDLITQTSRILGIQLTREAAYHRIKAILQKLIDGGELQQMTNGMINFSQEG